MTTQEEVRYVLLYRTPRNWRITIGLGDGLACGALPTTSSDAPFEDAAAEIAEILRGEYGVTEPLEWAVSKPDWWGADVVGKVPAEDR